MRKIPEQKAVLLFLPKRLWEETALEDPTLTRGRFTEQRAGLRQDCPPAWCFLAELRPAGPPQGEVTQSRDCEEDRPHRKGQAKTQV